MIIETDHVHLRLPLGLFALESLPHIIPASVEVDSDCENTQDASNPQGILTLISELALLERTERSGLRHGTLRSHGSCLARRLLMST